MTPDALALIDSARSALEQAQTLAGMRRGYALKDRVPGVSNVEEACAALGLSVEDFLATPPKAANGTS